MADPFLAEIRLFAGNFAPRGWALCEGQHLPINQNQALFALLGTTYGGDGQVTFALPDLRGRVPLAWGTGPGLSQRFLGERAGEEHHTLLAREMPAHAHGHADAQTTNRPENGVPARGGTYGTPTGDGPASGMRGGGQPHNTMQPYLALTFIIALQGIFPPRN